MDGEVLHQVELTEGFWLADTACTQELWTVVTGENPSLFEERQEGEAPRPVEQVSWDDCQEFVRRLSAAVSGLELRLPTEAEWEYACRAGTTTPFSFGTNVTTDQVNYNGRYPYAGGKKGEYRGKTVPVKSLPPNVWGLFEMHGNVWEWCLDWFAPYEPGLAVDPVCLEQAEGARVLRGGSWDFIARVARSASRYGSGPAARGGGIGFRVARGRPVQQAKPAEAEGARGPGEASGAKPPKGPRVTGAR